MFINYIIVAWRNLLKNRMVSFINILGLTLGLASAVLAILYARHEFTYEDCHENADHISKIYLRGIIDGMQPIPNTFGPEGETFKNMFPEIKMNSLSHGFKGIVRAGENYFIEDDILLADSAFFSIFTIPFTEGMYSDNTQTVVISENAAQRYFGSQSPLGKTLNIDCAGQKIDFLVTGVFKDFPSNTHLSVEFIIPFSLAKRFEFLKYDKYESTAYNSYVLLEPGTDIQEINNKIASSYKIPVDIENLSAFLMPVKEIHFKGTFENNKGNLEIFIAGGLFMLIISCINYINLTNILFSIRGKETGIRKVNGGKRINIIVQFLTDTLLSAIIGFNLAIILLKIILPWFNSVMDTHLILKPDIQFIGLSLLLFIVTVLLAGFFPAIRYSALKPVKLINSEVSEIKGKSYSRQILTTLQFFLAVIFIQIIMVMSTQNRYIFSDDIKKYNSENVICLNGYQWGDLNKVKQELLKNPSIKTVSWGSSIPSFRFSLTDEWENKDNDKMAIPLSFSKDYPGVFGIKMLKGRFFSDEYPSDRNNSIVINERTANELEFDDPLNKMMTAYGRQYEIIGIIDDYMAVPPIFNNMPLLITLSKNQNEFIVMLIDPLNRETAHKHIINTLQKFNPDYPVEIKYHEDILYEQKESKSYISAGILMNLFFILTIITSLIGLFSLSFFIAERNRKEVGIRKVFGASAPRIVLKLSKSLLIQIAIVIGLATPVSYFITEHYLSIFPYHFNPSILFYLFGGLTGSLVLILTVSWQTWRGANRNPVEALRCE
jgi:putative ABC transport system permease protein